MSQSKVSSRYTWTRNHDGRGKSVLEGAKDTVGLSARSSVFPSHSPKLKSKNRVWRPDRPTEKSGRSQGRRLSTTKAPGPSTKGKDRPYELSLGSSATHRRRRATVLHGNRVWVPNKVATTVYVEEGASTASLLPPQRVDNARQRVLNKPCTNVDDIVVNTSGACTVTPTVSSSPVCGSMSRRVAQSTSVGKRKRRHGNLVWRPGQAGAPTVSPGRLRCTALPSKGAVLRRSRGGALHATKYHWQRKLSVGSQSPSAKTVPSTSHSVNFPSWLQNRKLTHSRSQYQWKAFRNAPNSNSRLTPNQRLLQRSSAASIYKWSSGGSATSLSPSSSSTGGVQQPQRRVAHRSSLSWFSHAWLASNRQASADATRERKRPLSWDRPGRGKVPAKKKKMAANRIWIPSRLRVYHRRNSTSKRPSLEDDGRSAPLQKYPRETPTIPSSQSTKRMLASHAVRRSKAYFWSAKLSQKQKQLCMYYCRFGKCSRDNCPYIHDPEKITVCHKFVRGVCDKMDGSCLLSHKVDKSKMPVCSFYLRGVCGREECPYLHVNVGRDAEVCNDFLRGHCPHGTECPKLHAYHCPEFSTSGECSRGSQCPLKHQKLVQEGGGRGREVDESPGNVKRPKAFSSSKHHKRQPLLTEDDDGIISEAGGEQTDRVEGEDEQGNVLGVRPLDLNEMPDFIPL